MTEPSPLATLRGVRRRYGAVVALDGVDLDLRPGEVLALLGANGAGKSTAVGLMLGLGTPDAGEARLFGQPAGALAARRRTGVMLQSAGLPENARADELLALTRSYYPAPRGTDECVALAGLDGLLDRRYGRLSGGQQRRVQFALALCGRPQALFLDEPTTGLDIEARQGLWAAIRALVAEGTGVLLTTHYLEEAEALADRVVVLDRGRVAAAGRLAEVRALVSQRRIGGFSALDVAQVATWPGVRSAVRGANGDPARIEIVADDAEAVAIVRRLLAEDAALSDLEVRRAGLADAFLEITRDDNTRDATVAVQEAA
jgi:ABC-2 type transport system ATP-binding protein